MSVRTHLTSAAALFAAALTLSISASASPIAPGGGVTAAPITTTPTNILASYTNVAFTSQAPQGVASTFNGIYSAAVYTDSSNTLCGVAGSCLTFSFRVSNSSTSTDGIETVTSGPFSSLFSYNVGYAGTSDAPLTITDSLQNAIAFNFTTRTNPANIINPGVTSDYLIIQSSATSFVPGSISFQDTQTATVAGFIPAVAVTPEPSSLALLGTGLIGAAGIALRRRKLIA